MIEGLFTADTRSQKGGTVSCMNTDFFTKTESVWTLFLIVSRVRNRLLLFICFYSFDSYMFLSHLTA